MGTFLTHFFELQQLLYFVLFPRRLYVGIKASELLMAIVLIKVPAPIIGFDITYLKSTYVLAYVLSKYVKSKATHPS